MDKKQFVPKDFAVPAGLETEQFRLRMLCVEDVNKDYEAVMETQGRFLSMGYDWPRVGFTMEENLADLEQHQREFLSRVAFAYTVVSPDESRVLGCVYINPAKEEGIEARIRMWVRESEYKKGLDPVLFRAVQEWIEKEWPVEKVSYPERE
ncbi:MAG TPA: hypothetical protein VLM83_04005 [Anaerolineales bacterium]|nr:hypothetical protein [Anaerolineales bacterium]